MNLHAIAGPVVGAVNPPIPATLRVATGTSAPDGAGRRTPTYVDVPVTAQVQPLSYTDIQMADGLQLSGERRAIYVNGRFNSLNRPTNTGGDLVIFPSGAAWPFGTTWKVALVPEQWPDWCHLICTLQNGA